MTQKNKVQEVAVLWMHYTVITKMTAAYPEYLDNRACATVPRRSSEASPAHTGAETQEEEEGNVLLKNNELFTKNR